MRNYHFLSSLKALLQYLLVTVISFPNAIIAPNLPEELFSFGSFLIYYMNFKNTLKFTNFSILL